tara:strand:+ start:237 stop:1511 length:1275 start_codon:yes stop_codon:yes gene_type:complete
MPQFPVPGGGPATQDHIYYSNPEKYGEYQFINLAEIIDNFTAAYIGEGKILNNVLKADVSYHAHRALQELHYDTLTSCKSQEIILPPSLTMRLPKDYVNYTKIAYIGANGIEHVLYPTSKTSKGNKVQQDEAGNYLFTGKSKQPKLLNENPGINSPLLQFRAVGLEAGSNKVAVDHTHKEGYEWINGIKHAAPADVIDNTSTNSVFKVGLEIISEAFPLGTTIIKIQSQIDGNGFTHQVMSMSNPAFEFPTGWELVEKHRMFRIVDNTSGTMAGKYKGSGGNSIGITDPSSPASDNSNYFTNTGERYGLDPQYAQANGSFFIDCAKGLIHFSSNLSGASIILHYLSDGHGTKTELIVHKFAEEAMYKWIAYGCASARVGIPEGVIQRLKKERFAETRKAKIRLSNIKIEEITQLMRGKSKFIKH